MSDFCKKCGRPLSFDEVALYKKMICRGAVEYTCIMCLAEHFNVSEEWLNEKTAQFKKDGCTLFIKGKPI